MAGSQEKSMVASPPCMLASSSSPSTMRITVLSFSPSALNVFVNLWHMSPNVCGSSLSRGAEEESSMDDRMYLSKAKRAQMKVEGVRKEQREHN
jgi:hypothetical protein